MPVNNFDVLVRLKEAKEHRIYTYGEIARATGLSKSVIWRWRNKQLKVLDPRSIEPLCVWLKCGIGDLLSLG